MSIPQRLVILGLDSLPPDLVMNLAQNGTMPFIAKLISKGSFGPLRSVIPACTGSGWNSAWTGRTPAGHGYFGFSHYDFADDTIRLSTSDRLSATTLWEMFNMNGLRTIVINSPMQFPATKVDGVMVSGFMTPSAKTRCTFPESFRSKLLEEMPDYYFDVPWEKHKNDDATFETNVAYVFDVFNQRVRAARLAATCGPFDMLLVVFKSIDNMLHYTWDYVSDSSGHPRRHELTLQAFSRLDEACRELAILAGYPETNILLCSDHGHCPVKGHLYINRLLADCGFLRLHSKLERFANKLVTSYRKRFSTDCIRKKPSLDVGTRIQIDWHKSMAAMIGSTIYLNVKGRQPNGVVSLEQYHKVRDDIVSKLNSVKDDAGNRLIQKVECPPEASPEPVPPYQPTIPDILIEPIDGVLLKGTTRKGPVWHPGCLDYLQGCHSVNGFVLGAGPAFAEGNSVEGDLYDIAPTALAACGLGIPHGLEGKPITAMLAVQEQIKYEKTKDIETKAEETPPEDVYNPDEEKHITQQLRDLGYLD